MARTLTTCPTMPCPMSLLSQNLQTFARVWPHEVIRFCPTYTLPKLQVFVKLESYTRMHISPATCIQLTLFYLSYIQLLCPTQPVHPTWLQPVLSISDTKWTMEVPIIRSLDCIAKLQTTWKIKVLFLPPPWAYQFCRQVQPCELGRWTQSVEFKRIIISIIKEFKEFEENTKKHLNELKSNEFKENMHPMMLKKIPTKG